MCGAPVYIFKPAAGIGMLCALVIFSTEGFWAMSGLIMECVGGGASDKVWSAGFMDTSVKSMEGGGRLAKGSENRR